MCSYEYHIVPSENIIKILQDSTFFAEEIQENRTF